jgi:hypothetical protein
VAVRRGHGIASERKKTFAESNKINRDSLEVQTVRELWRWAFAGDDVRREIEDPRSELAGCLEFYLCHLLDFVPAARSLGWWCDGVLSLSIARPSRLSIRVAGTAYLDSCGVGPFELEFHFARRRGVQPTRIMLRCGHRDQLETTAWRTKLKNAAAIVRARPPRDDEWAIAVEFTPEEE